MAYVPTYVTGDLAPIAANGIGTAGAAVVPLLPLVVTAGVMYGGAKYAKGQYDKYGKKKAKKKKKHRMQGITQEEVEMLHRNYNIVADRLYDIFQEKQSTSESEIRSLIRKASDYRDRYYEATGTYEGLKSLDVPAEKVENVINSPVTVADEEYEEKMEEFRDRRSEYSPGVEGDIEKLQEKNGLSDYEVAMEYAKREIAREKKASQGDYALQQSEDEVYDD